MALIDTLIPILYIAVAVITFTFGFLLVFRNLKKINLIEGEKFTTEDWVSCLAFAAIFSLVITFAINMAVDFLVAEPILDIAGFLLLILVGFLFIYPLWEIFFLGRPTSDAVHGFHKFLETKILDKFKGKVAYLISLLIFLVIYIAPIIIISALTEYGALEIAFVWFLVFPLFFLNTYAASGQMANIVGATYRNRIKRSLYLEKPKLMKKLMQLIFLVIAWVPFIISIYNIYGPISTAIQGGDLKDKVGMSAYLSLFTTVAFGIQGFFTRFWNKKSKTKTIDFIFSGYIFIAIGINMLLNFIAINPDLGSTVFSISIFGWQPLTVLTNVFSNYYVILPLIVIQDLTKVIFGITLFFDKDFVSDIRLSSANSAFGQRIEQIEEKGLKTDTQSSEAEKMRPKRQRKIDIQTLAKSVLLPPNYNKLGIDINHIVRQKAAQFLFLISVDNKILAQQIVEIIAKNTIEMDQTKSTYLVKEAVDLLGTIGKVYPEFILERFMRILGTANTQVQTDILDAIGDIGESKENLISVLEKIKPLLISQDYEIRVAAYTSIVEMVTEGQFEDKEFVATALSPIYQVLDEHYRDAEIIDSALEAIVKMCAKVSQDIDFNKILRFLHYNEGTQEEIKEYILESTISILASTVYFNLDKFPLADVRQLLNHKQSYIRYVAADAVGNFILKGGTDQEKNDVVLELIKHSLQDSDIDVVSICAESIAEFLVMRPDYTISENGNKSSILDHYMKLLGSPDSKIAENASEALKSIAPMYPENIYPLLAAKIQGSNLEIARDCMHTLGLLDEKIHEKVDLKMLYERSEHADASVRAEAVFALGGISQHRKDVDEDILLKHLEDVDPQVRLETIFTLGKLAILKPEKIEPKLIEKFFFMDRQSSSKVSEVELYAETLGLIGERHPSNEIVIALDQALMGDTNVFAKDIIAKGLGHIGNGMIQSGKAIRRIEDEAFYNAISWFQASRKQEYTIGNLIIMFIEALQQRNIPSTVMDIISDSIQDLLPTFVFTKSRNPKHPNEIMLAIKELLGQAYYSNYNQEILETLDRIDSLLNFKRIFEEQDPALKEQFKFYAEQYTPDGKQFHDQGETFILLEASGGPQFLDYALKSFEIAIELAPNEYYTPNCYMQLGFLFKKKKDYPKAKANFEEALNLFAAQDEIEAMKQCEQNLEEIKNL